jgi:hypothetical protein
MVVVPIGRWIGRVSLVIVVAPFWGCAHGPRNFRKVQNPAPLVRARAVSLGRRVPDLSVMATLVDRLSDSDPVVRLAAHEELRKRTGRDFGYVPWASPEERAGAIEQWKAFVGQGRGSPSVPAPVVPSPSSPSKALPVGTSQMPPS